MKDINKIMPKVPGMKWGALMNYSPENAELKKINQMMPKDGRWHTILEHDGDVSIDNVTIRKKTADSMT